MTTNNQTIYETINYFEPIAFVAGSEYTVPFVTYEIDDNGDTVLLDLTAGSAEVRLSCLGISEPLVLTVAGTITDASNGEWNVVFETADTENLEGVFTMQPVITDFNGKEFIPGQGQVTIFPKNKP